MPGDKSLRAKSPIITHNLPKYPLISDKYLFYTLTDTNADTNADAPDPFNNLAGLSRCPSIHKYLKRLQRLY
jgi:hypothetical protein